MFDIGLQEMVVIGVIALLVFGPSRLPELGRMVGRAMRELRRASDEFRSTVETNLHMNDLDPAPPSPTAPVTEEPATPAAEPAAATPLGSFETASAAPATVVEPAEPFCAQRGGRLLHRRECSWVARIPEVDRAYVATAEEGREKGLVGCPACEPWVPA